MTDRTVQTKRLLAKIVIVPAVAGCLLAWQQPAGPGDPQVHIVPREHPETKQKPADLRVDVNMVMVPVTVTDPTGTPVVGLPRDAFHVFEDGVEQPLARLTNQDSPVSAGLVIDASASMTYKMDRARQAVTEFLKTSTPGDEYFLVQFNDSAQIVTGFTSKEKDINDAMTSIQPIGWTSLLDAIYLSVSQMKRAHNSRRALVLLSDGGDNNSRFSEHEIRELLRESNVTLYAIGMLGPVLSGTSNKLLKDLAASTGGRMFPVKDVSELPDAMERLSKALREQYTLAYPPTNTARDGRFRKVLVKVVAPPGWPALRATFRNGYYAPGP